ncbi:plastocyanin/azurin family copper-binding protein [Blastococcus sp. KM273128]|uniref:cupredoxin domain-containing protein n=1 Tax=Blastococcus sp. KM273128 TaxID=2570314 RepID=UPI001F00733F|nr:plastocyanin/azurin family copper-binding protein [Blastococcus sp. KM273128]
MRSWKTRPAARRLAVALTGLALVVTGCGSDDPDTEATAEVTTESSPPAAAETTTSSPASSPSGEQEAETVEAQLVDFAIELDEDSYSAGTYEFAVTNQGDASHDFIVERDGEDVTGTAVLQPGQSETLTVDLEPGTYVFYCSVGNHRAMGMEVSVEVS